MCNNHLLVEEYKNYIRHFEEETEITYQRIYELAVSYVRY